MIFISIKSKHTSDTTSYKSKIIPPINDKSSQMLYFPNIVINNINKNY